MLPFQPSGSEGIAAFDANKIRANGDAVAAALSPSAENFWIGASTLANSSSNEPARASDVASSLRIAIVVTSDDEFAASYQWHTDSVRCYAEQHGYVYIRVPTRDVIKRHGVVLKHLEKADWFLFLDGDSMVVNFNRRIEEYVDPDVNLVLVQRLINGEIASGAYLIRNSAWSREFLDEVLAYRGKVANPNNGIFMSVLARRLLQTVPEGIDRQAAETCLANFEKGEEGYT